MSRRPTAVALLAAVAAFAAIVGLVAAPAAATTASDATTVDATAASDATTVDATAASDATVAGDVADDDVNFTVELPNTVAANVTQEYSIDLTSANGSVNATWRFPSATKNGTTVEHAFPEGGNVTFTVTVTDESGASETREVTVQVVDYRDDDEGGAGSDFGQFFGTVVIMLLVLGVFPAAMYLFVLPTVMEHVTDAFD